MNKGFHSLSDLMNLKHETFKRNNTFGTFTKLLDRHIDAKVHPDREKRARAIVRFVIKRFWHYVLIDIIRRNTEFVFPYKVFYLSIRSRKTSSKYYRYDIEKQGYDFIPYITINEAKRNILRRMFNVKLGKYYQKMLDQEIKSGHRYEEAPPTHYRK